MAQQVQIVMTDDIDGSTSEDINTVRFGLDTANYEIDLNPENQQKLYEALSPFVEKARKLKKRDQGDNASGRKRSSSSDPGRTKAIRAWAAENGIEVSDRGRISQEIQDRYDAEQGNK